MNIRKPWKQTPSYKGEEKAESYNFFDISSFFRFDTHRNALGVLSDQTCSDLGFEDLFMFSDRTASRAVSVQPDADHPGQSGRDRTA